MIKASSQSRKSKMFLLQTLIGVLPGVCMIDIIGHPLSYTDTKFVAKDLTSFRYKVYKMTESFFHLSSRIIVNGKACDLFIVELISNFQQSKSKENNIGTCSVKSVIG